MKRLLIVAFVLLGPAVARAQADSITQRVTSAIAKYEKGERAAATNDFFGVLRIYNVRAGTLTAKELSAVATAVKYLAELDPRGSPQGFKDAMRVYDEAIAKDPSDLGPRVELAALFLDKYNSAEAKRTLGEVLTRNPDYVPGLLLDARRRAFDNEPGADSVLNRALELEPENAKGRVMRARFLADVEDFAGARREVDRALRTQPNDAEALAFGLALAIATGDSAGHIAFGRRYATLYPREAGAHVAVAELLARVRQYAAAASWARQGIAIDSTNWHAYSVLGLNLLRLGDITPARQSLETSFKGDPYNVWVKNTLDLLDTFGEYDELTRGQFRFVIEKAESGILALYLGELADRAFATFSARYGFVPSGPIRMEIYRSHADFSVRTVGLAGLGALGVSFGNTVAFDSPAAKDAGPFNWASTAWHELAHTFTLGASDMRVPRWLSEGLSVYEERRGRRGWGQNVSLAFLQAYIDGKLVPVSRMNDGFVRPAYPQQVLHSYYEASLVCELIARDFGEKALSDMLRAYRSGLGTEQVVRRVLKTDLPSLDRRFDAYMVQRFGTAIAAIRDKSYEQQVALGRGFLERGNAAEAVSALERARALFPDYGGAESAYPALARALIAQGERRKAADVMSTMVGLGDVSYDTHVTLADLLLVNGDTARAAEALESAMFMNPYEIAEHDRLAILYAHLGDTRKAIRERRAVVALNPVDAAEAYYLLAVAYWDAGEMPDARRTVLRALENAPHFERAQELLLALHEAAEKRRKP